MGFVKKKQIYGLDGDINNLYFGGTVLQRTTVLNGATPSSGEASVNTSTAEDVTTLRIHTNDSLIGNSYFFLNELIEGDKVVIKSGDDQFSIYAINSISSEIDTNTNEGYFILTIQHSFGYASTLSSGVLAFYIRKSISAEIESNKYAANHSLTAEIGAKINHGLNTTDVIVQVKDGDGVLVNNPVVENYALNSVDITVDTTGTYRVIILS